MMADQEGYSTEGCGRCSEMQVEIERLRIALGAANVTIEYVSQQIERLQIRGKDGDAQLRLGIGRRRW